ncbi:MAG: hypothetical protein IKO49_03825 [Bacilli bacterium]|nr:hypothetical protein [Clostridia bacterium]MBR4618415.1 hypothetical protein [Bacilli bacterium]
MAEALKRKEITKEETKTYVRRQREQKEETGIETNTFYSIIMSEDTELEDKVNQVSKALEFTNDKEADRTRIKEFEQFKEYLQSISETMSKQRIEMTDTGTFSELQKVYGDFNNDLNDFIEKIKPLTDITDALYTLRKNGETRSVLAKIQQDKANRRNLEELLESMKHDLSMLEENILQLKQENYKLAEDKSFFGFGNIRAESKAQIKANEDKITEFDKNLHDLLPKIDNIRQQLTDMSTGEGYSFEAQKLKELLDLNSEQHVQRQADLVQSALQFINSGKERFGEIRNHLELMNQQIEGLTDNNSQMQQIYAVLNDGTKKAEEANKAKRETLINAPEPTSQIEKMKLDKEKRDLDEFIDTVSQSTVDTMQTYGELSMEEIKLRNMQAATKNQSQSAATMHSRGIASVASQLSVVLTAVNSAAINESQVMASDTLTQMANVTNDVAKKESIRIATGRDDVNIELEKTLQDLVEFGDTQRQATEITRDAIKTMRDNLDELEKLSKDVQEDTADFVAVTADTIDEKKAPKKEKKDTSKSIFKGI